MSHFKQRDLKAFSIQPLLLLPTLGATPRPPPSGTKRLWPLTGTTITSVETTVVVLRARRPSLRAARETNSYKIYKEHVKHL